MTDRREPQDAPPPGGALDRAAALLARFDALGRIRGRAALATVVWTVLVAAYAIGFFGASEARGTAFLDGAFFLVAWALPTILIWLAAFLAEELARLRDLVAGLAPLAAELAATREVLERLPAGPRTVAADGAAAAALERLAAGQADLAARIEAGQAQTAAGMERLVAGQADLTARIGAGHAQAAAGMERLVAGQADLTARIETGQAQAAAGMEAALARAAAPIPPADQAPPLPASPPLPAARPAAARPRPARAPAPTAQGGLPPPEEPAAEPELPWSDVIRALDFPRDAEDAEGFRALKAALGRRSLAQMLQAAEDVLTILSQEGVYMDDLAAAPAEPEAWRRFVAGGRGEVVAGIGGVTDPAALGTARRLMQQDTVFRDTTLFFLRRFDAALRDIADGAGDAEIAEIADTRSGRAFQLMARASGAFD